MPEHWVDSSGDSVFAAQRHPKILHLLHSYGGTMDLQVYAAAHRIDVIAEVLKLAPSRPNEVLPYGWDDNGAEDLALNIMNLCWAALKYPKVYRLLQAHGANPDLSLLGMAGDLRRRDGSVEDQLRAMLFLSRNLEPM